MDLKGTETEKNLMKAFEINAKRRMEYDIYALIAEKQGFKDLARLMTRYANNEKEHSKLWYKWLKCNSGCLPSLLDSAKDALKNEKDEIEGIYEKFAQKPERKDSSISLDYWIRLRLLKKFTMTECIN